MKRLVVTLLVLSLLLITGAGSAWSAVVSLPYVHYTGQTQTTAGIGTGTFTLDAFVSYIRYLDATSCSDPYNTGNNPCGPDESVIDNAEVTISGAVRTGDYTYTDAVLSITDPDDSFNYLTATLSNITFVTDGTSWYLNPQLHVCDQTTLNLSNIVLNTDVDHPSRFIDELQSVLDINNISGMNMILLVYSGNFSGDSSASVQGVTTGPPSIIDEVPRSVGYWKNHSGETVCFDSDAVSDNIDVLNIFETDTVLRSFLNKKGKKTMEQKAKQQLAALLLNIAAGLDPSELLTSGQLAILQEIDTSYGADATIGDAVFEIENAILTEKNLEIAKDLAESINNN